MKSVRHKRTNTVWFHVCEVPRDWCSKRQKAEAWEPGSWGERVGELGLKRFRAWNHPLLKPERRKFSLPPPLFCNPLSNRPASSHPNYQLLQTTSPKRLLPGTSVATLSSLHYSGDSPWLLHLHLPSLPPPSPHSSQNTDSKIFYSGKNIPRASQVAQW